MPLLSVQRIVEIGAVGIAAALFVPGLRALPDEGYPLIPFLLWQGAGQAHALHAGKVIPPLRYGVHTAYRTEKIGVGYLIPHDAAGYGGNPLVILKWSVALLALHDRQSKKY
jgi:hypothetical protein